MSPLSFLGRRDFFHHAGAAVGAITLGGLWAASQTEDDPSKASAGGPANPSWQTTIVSADEPGETLVVSGTIFAADGKSPVAGAQLYVYQTDAKGYYVPPGSPRRVARIRGWMKTGADGRYEFRTIRPGSYPGSRIAAHIHGTLAAPGRAPQWIEDFLFHGDPFLNPRDAERSAGRATFANVLKPERAADGILRARRDFRIQTA